MPEKFEPQFFKPEKVPEREEEKIKVPEELKVEKAPEIKEKKAITLEEKAEAVRDFIETRRKGGFFREREKFLLKLKPEELEEIIGKEDLALIYSNFSTANAMRQEMVKGGLKEEEIRQFVVEKGIPFLPERIRCAMVWLDHSDNVLYNTLNILTILGMEKMEAKSETARISPLAGLEELKESRNINIQEMEFNLELLRQEIDEWQKYLKFEREKKEKLTKIEGFETFDYPQMKGEKIIEKLLKILPKGSQSINIERIEYMRESESIPEEYGVTGKYTGAFAPEATGKGVIQLFESPDTEKPIYLKELTWILPHEWAHSLDPRIINQKNLLPAEQLKMIVEWEKIRAKEPEFSSYVLKIKNKDELLENSLKSQESFAESIATLLANPFFLNKVAPKRYEFCLICLKKFFPEFDPIKSQECARAYEDLIDELEWEVKELKRHL